MFDIAFSEFVIIFLVALVVIGPERLPGVARTAGRLWGRMQRYMNRIRNDIANDMAIEEASRLRDSAGKEIAAIGQSVLDARLTAEQKIVQTRHDKSPSAASDAQGAPAQSSAASGKPV